MKNIILIGFMGSGKSTIGRILSEKYELKHIDTDWYIEKEQNMKISDIFSKKGEEYFRNLETECIKKLIDRYKDNIVVSVGGGLPVKDVNRKLLHTLGTVVYLKAEVSTLENRLSGDNKRPLLKGGDLHGKIISLMEKRQAIYEQTSDLIVKTDGLQCIDVVKIIKEEIDNENIGN